MRILFISSMAASPWGGSEELWVRSAEYAVSCGHEVVISVYDWGALHPKIKSLEDRGAKIILRKKVFFGMGMKERARSLLIKKLFSSREVKRLKKINAEAIVVSQGTIFEIFFNEYKFLFEKSNVPYYIITQANSEYETVPQNCFAIGREIVKNAQRMYFVSRRNKIVSERQLAMKIDNFDVVYNPANVSVDEIVEWNENDELQIAMVGRLNSSVKGIGVLLEILSDSVWKDRKWHLNLYGKGADINYLKELIEFFGLSDKVSFRGFSDNLVDLWRTNHVICMPSTLEGTPLSLIEAMLCGRPAVVSDVGGNAELITEGLSGFVSEAPSVYSFGRALERLWSNKMKLKEMGISANQEVLKKVDFNSHKKIVDYIISVNNHGINKN